jgi:hypothetical protein
MLEKATFGRKGEPFPKIGKKQILRPVNLEVNSAKNLELFFNEAPISPTFVQKITISRLSKL